MTDWLTRALEPYKGSWPPYPGMYPALALNGERLLTIFIWDKDISQERLSEEVATVLMPKEDMAVAIHFGTPDEITAYIKQAQATKSVILDTSGMTAESQREFALAGQRHDLGMLTINAGERR